MIEADVVVFDFDDTIRQTHFEVFTLENAVAQKLGLPPITEETHALTWGKPFDEAIPLRYPGANMDDFRQERHEMLQILALRGEVDQVSPENLAVLDELLRRNKRLAVLTSRTVDEARHLLEVTHPLNPRVEKIFLKGDSPFHKPDFRVFDQVLAYFAVSPNRAVYVGDQPSDAEASTDAGLHSVITLESGIRKKADFAGFNCVFINRFTDLLNVIR